MDCQQVASLQRSTPNMKCHSMRSFSRRSWLSSSDAYSLVPRGSALSLPYLNFQSESLFSAFNAIISASVVALGVSYAIPPAINCLRGRKMLPQRPFVLPGPLGWMCNLLGIAYVIVTTVLFLFPPTLPVTGSNMSKQSSPRHHQLSVHASFIIKPPSSEPAPPLITPLRFIIIIPSPFYSSIVTLSPASGPESSPAPLQQPSLTVTVLQTTAS